MKGNPSEFEAIGSRLGFRVERQDEHRLSLKWQGTRFPALLCLGIAVALLFLSVPILQALRLRGFEGPAGALWYFPIMNFVLLGISFFLFSLKRTILVDRRSKQLIFYKRSFLRRALLTVNFDEVTGLWLGMDQVYSGFAVAGSSANESFPVPSLRLSLRKEATLLVDRGGVKRLQELGERLSRFLGKNLEIENSLNR